MKRNYIKPMTAVCELEMQQFIAASGEGSSSWETSGDGNTNPDQGNIGAGGDASEFGGGTGAKENNYRDLWED